MELDELKASWRRLDERIGELTAINRRLMNDALARKARWRLAPTVVGAIGNVLISGWFALVWRGVWAARLDTPLVAAAGLALHLAALGLVVIGITRLVPVARIDYAQPVLAIQRSLAKLQEFEAFSFHAVWFGSWVLTPAAIVVLVMGVAEVNLWQRAPGWLAANFLVCLAGGFAPPALHYWARRRNRRLAAWFDGFLTSRSIGRARAAIAEIDEFARS